MRHLSSLNTSLSSKGGNATPTQKSSTIKQLEHFARSLSRYILLNLGLITKYLNLSCKDLLIVSITRKLSPVHVGVGEPAHEGIGADHLLDADARAELRVAAGELVDLDLDDVGVVVELDEALG